MKKQKIELNVKPNTSRLNKTGSWRTKKPLTDLKACIGCSLCAKICPEGCIEMIAAGNQAEKSLNKLKPQTDYDFCKGCALCAHECPVKAIIMENDYE